MTPQPRHYCERCARPVIAVGPHWLRRVAVWAAFAFFTVLTFVVGASGLLLFGGGIVVFALGALVLGPLYTQAYELRRCPSCRRVVVPVARADASTRVERSPRRQPA